MYIVLEGVLVRTSNRSATTFNLRLKVVPNQYAGISYNNQHLPGRLLGSSVQPVTPPAAEKDRLETFATQTNRRLSILQSECRSMFVHPR